MSSSLSQAWRRTCFWSWLITNFILFGNFSFTSNSDGFIFFTINKNALFFISMHICIVIARVSKLMLAVAFAFWALRITSMLIWTRMKLFMLFFPWINCFCAFFPRLNWLEECIRNFFFWWGIYPKMLFLVILNFTYSRFITFLRAQMWITTRMRISKYFNLFTC